MAGSNSEGIPTERCNQLGSSIEGSGVVIALGRQGGCQDQEDNLDQINQLDLRLLALAFNGQIITLAIGKAAYHPMPLTSAHDPVTSRNLTGFLF